jgi:SH3-like domain-containing protein
MFSEPTISPNFVVRQKRKLIRHPLVMGGILCIVIIGIAGLVTLFTPKDTTSDEPEVRITFESRIIFDATPEANETQEPTIVIQAPVIDSSEPIINDDNTASSQTASVQPRCKITTTGDTNVNIRSGPDIIFSLISSLSNRDSVDVIASSDNRWFQILNTDGTIGWVGGSVVDKTGDCESLSQIQMPACAVKNTTGNLVNIRNNASTDSNIIRTLASSDLLMADGRTIEGWYRILLTGELGWIYQDVVALSDACGAVPIISANEPIPQPALSETSVVFNDGDCVVESFMGTAIDLRKGPGMEFAVVAKMSKPMVANRLSSNGWYEIDGFGWAFAGDLVYGGLCNLLPTITPDEIRGSSLILTGG